MLNSKGWRKKVNKSALCEVKREVKNHNKREDKTDDETPIVYRKIIQYVVTRWNSTCMLIDSILNLRDALERIREFPGKIHYKRSFKKLNKFY